MEMKLLKRKLSFNSRFLDVYSHFEFVSSLLDDEPSESSMTYIHHEN